MKNTRARTAVRIWLASHNQTQVGLATELGIDESALSKILNGYKTPSETLAADLLKKTGIDLRQYMEVAS